MCQQGKDDRNLKVEIMSESGESMADLTEKDIQNAVETLKKNCVTPTKILMNPIMADKVIKMLHEKGIETKGKDGNDYVFGMKVIIDKLCDKEMAYIK